jgi:hypothetical protein
VFNVDVHDLNLEIEDIYFLTRMSRRGEQISLSGFREVVKIPRITLHNIALSGQGKVVGRFSLKM